MANPENQNFEFTQESMKKFLKELLIGENFGDGAITLSVSEKVKVKEGEEEKTAESLDQAGLLDHALTPGSVDDFGLKFFLENW